MPRKRKTKSQRLSDGEVVVENEPTTREQVVQQVGKVLGDSGTQRYAGYYTEEYNSDWRDEKRVDTVEEMRRGDGACKAAIKAIKAPLLGAKWSVNYASDAKNAEDIRWCAEQALFHMPGRRWDSFLREALEYLSFGHYAFELIWMVDGDGNLRIKDLAPRIPRSIQRWKLKDGRQGIVQYIRTDDFKGSEAEIPMDKLLVFTNDKEGSDITGQSILRSAYKHYYYKNLAYKVESISGERFGVGIPVVWLPEGAGEDEKEEAEDLAGNIRSNEKGFIVLPGPKANGWDIQIITPQGNPHAQQLSEGIKHHNRMILVSVLENFLGLDDLGSYAKSSDLSSFFLSTLADSANYMVEEIGRQVIRRVIDANYGPQETYPELHYSPLGDVDLGMLSDMIKTLVESGLVTPNARIKKWTTETFNLPEIPDDELEAMKEAELEEELQSLEGGFEDDGMDLPEDDDEEPDEEPEGE